MIANHTFLRFFHTSSVWLTSNNKLLLSKLRKKTGYTFTNCKKALEVNDFDLSRAEQWLKEQAQALGWAKALKVAGRSTSQGLVAVTVDQKTAAMVEVNCETDFVARNSIFQSLTTSVANVCFEVAKKQTDFNNSIAKSILDNDQLNNLVNSEGKSLKDEVALVISQIGENVVLRRATCVNLIDDLSVSGYTHPTPPQPSNTLFGKYGALLIYKAPLDNSIQELGKQLCQHIIGMKPEKIGDTEKDTPKENKEDETIMIYQEFLMEPEVPISQVLSDSGISLIEFTRYQCGEDDASGTETGGNSDTTNPVEERIEASN